jgi:hypothetical protein
MDRVQQRWACPVTPAPQAGKCFKPPGRRARGVSGSGDRRGIGQLGPSEQVMIDGPQPSSSSGPGRRGGNPRADLGGGVPHLSASSGHGKATSGRGASRQARRGAAGLISFLGRSSCMTAMEELARACRDHDSGVPRPNKG